MTKRGGSENHGDRHTREKVEREEVGRKVDKVIKDERPYTGSDKNVKDVTGQDPVKGK